MHVMPRNVEYQILQIYVWFSHISLHQQGHKQLCETINVVEAPQVSDTRWLAVSMCLNQVLDQYRELKLYSWQKTRTTTTVQRFCCRSTQIH